MQLDNLEQTAPVKRCSAGMIDGRRAAHVYTLQNRCRHVVKGNEELTLWKW